ncbi:MAG: hypothetical protein H0X47_21525 [Nitrospirales bacterium]|nr:hypothetical protein [Nitrospirales bacterium]
MQARDSGFVIGVFLIGAAWWLVWSVVINENEGFWYGMKVPALVDVFGERFIKAVLVLISVLFLFVAIIQFRHAIEWRKAQAIKKQQIEQKNAAQ